MIKTLKLWGTGLLALGWGAWNLWAMPGELDAQFHPVLDGAVRAVVALPNGQALIGGAFHTVDGQSRAGIARLNHDGSLDAAFDPGTGIGTDPGFSVAALLVRPDGKIVLGGSFTNFNGYDRYGVARLNSDGSLDASFVSTSRIGTSEVRCLAQQSDGKLLLGGAFNLSGVLSNYWASALARVNMDGSLDAGFGPQLLRGVPPLGGLSASVQKVVIQSNGQILVQGFFNQVVAADGTSANTQGLIRLNPDGSIDKSFSLPPVRPFTLAVQSDGRVLIEGYTYSEQAGYAEYFQRLDSVGQPDASFAPILNGKILLPPFLTTLAVQTDGKILLAGPFITVNGVARDQLARLHADGSLDTGFAAAAGTDQAASVISVQEDGGYLIGGGFTTVNGQAQAYLAHLKGNDTSARPPAILQAPASQEIGEWKTASFAVSADGPALTYQWQFNSATLAWATNSTLTLTPVLRSYAGLYTVAVSNAWGCVTSAPATLVVDTLDAALNAANLVWESVLASLEPYWYGASNMTVIPTPGWLAQTNITHDGQIAAQGVIDSTAVYGGGDELCGLLQTRVVGPGTLSFWSRGNLEFGYSAAGAKNVYLHPYFWENRTLLSSAEWQKTTIKVPSGARILVWKSRAYPTSTQQVDQVAYLPLTGGPQITGQPQSQTIVEGDDALFSVAATGDGLTYQWRLNGKNLPSATNATLELHQVTGLQSGYYGVIVSTPSGSETSLAALLKVAPQSLWQSPSGTIGAPSSLVFSPDAQTLAAAVQSTNLSANLGLLNVKNGNVTAWLGSSNAPGNVIGYSRDGSLLVAIDNEKVCVWRVASGQLVAQIPGLSAAFAPDGNSLAISAGGALVKLVNVADGSLQQILTAHTEVLPLVAYSPLGDIVAAACADHTIELWRVSDGQRLPPFIGHTDQIKTLTFSRDGRLLASGGADSILRLWRMSDHSLVRSITLPHEPKDAVFANEIVALAFAPDGQTLGVASRRHLYFWRVTEHRFVDDFLILEADSWQEIKALAISPNARYFAYSVSSAPYFVLARNPALSYTDLQLVAQGVDAAGKPQFSLLSNPGAICQIERSLDFTNWVPILTLTNASSPTVYTDPQPPAGSSVYYRAVAE